MNTQKTRVDIDSTRLNTFTRKTKAASVEQEMCTLINSSFFKKIFTAKFNQRNYYVGELSQWNEATPEEILLHILRGGEINHPYIDYVINIQVDDYYSIKRVIGYTKKNIDTVYTNTRYYDVRNTKQCGQNFFHEYGHKLGFSHDFFRTKRRSNSICYLMGEVYGEAYDELFGKPQTLVCRRPWKYLKLRKVCK